MRRRKNGMRALGRGTRSVVRGFPIVLSAVRGVFDDPLVAVGMVLGLPIALVVAPLWGGVFALIGWIAARRALEEGGIAGLGEVMAPRLARAQFSRQVQAGLQPGAGVELWRGLWRVQTIGVALLLVELPAVAVAAAPAALVWALSAPLEAMFPGSLGETLRNAPVALVAAASALIVLAQVALTLRVLSERGPEYSLGLVYRASAASWRATIADIPVLIGTTGALLLVVLFGGAFVAGTLELAKALELGSGLALVLSWSAGVAGVVVLAVAIESVLSWAARVPPAELVVDTADALSVSAWLAGWLRGAREHLVGVGLVACGLVGLAVCVRAFATGEDLRSWVALGWFGVTAMILVALELKRRRA